VSETGDAIVFRQQLSTTSCDALELEITVNYPVHTLTEIVQITASEVTT